MSWGLAFRIRQTLKGSLWVLPLIGGLAGYVLSEASVRVEGSTHARLEGAGRIEDPVVDPDEVDPPKALSNRR